jgi:CBS domain-containing protein
MVMEMKVEEAMSTDVIAVSVPGRRKVAVELMKKNNVSGLPVVKEKTKKLVGFVSLQDLMKKRDEDQLALVMNRQVITISPKKDVIDAAKLMIEKNVRTLPVVEADNLAGVVTVDDIVKRAIIKSTSTERIEKYIKYRILTMWENTPMPVALKILSFSDDTSAGVLDEKGNLVGIIDAEDFMKSSEIINLMEKSDIQQNSEGEDWMWETKSTLYIGTEILHLPNKPVKEYMTKDVQTTTMKTSVVECARIMRKYDIEQLPVVTAGGDLVGIVRDVDLVKFLVKK